jgi:hypothetical protein
MSKAIARVLWLAAAVPLAAALVTGCAQGSGSTAPQSCKVAATAGRQLATTVQPGDAGWYWIPQARAYLEFVCTDGTLVHIAGYGN